MPNIAGCFKRAFNSTFLLTLLLITGLDLVITEIKPLRYFNTTGFTPLDQNPLVAKLPEFMHSKENPEILLLGSSLTLIPAVRCDDELAGVKTRYDEGYRRNFINGYSKAEYLRLQIEKQLGQKLNIRNLGVIASMFSDHYLILEKALASGKKPQTVICCIAPRDFLDNYRSQVEKTPVYQVLADLTLINDLIERGASFHELANYATGVIWHYYQVRTDYKTFFNSLTAQSLNHPTTLYSATNSNADCSLAPAKTVSSNNSGEEIEVGLLSKNNQPDYVKKPNTLGDLETYKGVYAPLNTTLFDIQTQYLKKMLVLCKENKIELYLVNTPLTKENKQLLPSFMWQRYFQTVSSMATAYGAHYVNADKPAEFTTLNDFEDSCHLNAYGGKKFYGEVIEALRANTDSQRSLAKSASPDM